MKPEPGSGDEVIREIFIEAAPERVYEFFTVPEKLAQWWGSSSRIDPRPGGIYQVEFLDGRAVAAGEFVELVPNHRIVHTWGWEGEVVPLPPGSSVVEITLSKSGEGTLVTVRHGGLRGTGEFHLFGWTYYLPRLAAVAMGEDPGEDRLSDFIGSFPTSSG